MKRIALLSATILALAAPALADCGLRDADGIRLAYSSAPEDAPTFAHGCDAFQRFDLSGAQLTNLLRSGNCPIENDAGEDRDAGADPLAESYAVSDADRYRPFNGCRIGG